MAAPTSEQIRTEVERAKKQYLEKHGEEAAAIDCHSHSAFSLTLKGFIGSDGDASVEDMFRTAKERGLDGLLLTNHDNFGPIDSALGAAEKEGLYTLPAIEVSSKDGHVLGIFPKDLTNKQVRALINPSLYVGQSPREGFGGVLERLPTLYQNPQVKDKFKNSGDRSFPDVSAEETVKYIHDFGGVAVAAHPYFETVGLGKEKFNELAGKFDGMEQFDGTAGLADMGSSDAHTTNGVGAGVTLIPKRYLKEEGGLLKAIRERKCESFRTTYYGSLGDYDLTNISMNRFVRIAIFTPIMGGMLYRNRRGQRIEEQMVYEKLNFVYAKIKEFFTKKA